MRALALLFAAMAQAAPAAVDDSALRALMDDGSGKPDALVGLQVALVREGRVVAELAYGRRFVHPSDRAQDLPLTTDSLVRVASMSKPVSAIAIMQLVERRKLDLDADVSRVLGFKLRNPRFPAVPITLRQVLSHTASLADGDGYYMPLGKPLADFFTTDAHFTAYPPGARFQYANLGSGVLATVLERATRERFDQLVAERVLAPAGVEGSFDVAGLSPAQKQRLAVTYRRGAEEAPVWDPTGPWLPQNDDWRGDKFMATSAQPGIARYRPGTNGTLFSPQGGLRTSAGQYARLMLCLLRDACAKGPLLTPASRVEMLRTQWRHQGDDPPSGHGDDTNGGQYRAWGLGLQLFPDTGEVGHLAEAYGLFGGALFAPDGATGVVYLATGSAMPLAANKGKRSAFYAWEETIQDWARDVSLPPP
jgi:CubicO group peptidase (beta-lactamase class C family)